MDSDAHASWLRDVLSELDMPKPSVVGLSLGGWIALDFAIRHATMVDKLVLLTPGGIADKNILAWALPLLLLGPWGARKVSERIVGRLPRIDSDLARTLAALSAAIFGGMRPRTEKLPRFTDEQLANLEMPVLALLGENDVTMDSQLIKERVERNITNSTVAVVHNMRHFLGDQTASIGDFLARNLRDRELESAGCSDQGRPAQGSPCLQ
jgi:pimeloyl-ACP methyl ester carboxylesterase